MNLVLEARVLSLRQQLRIVGHDVAQGLDPRPFGLGEVVEHVRVHEVLDARMTDADAHAAIVVADMRGDRAQPVMSGDAAADFHPDFPRREFDLVVENGDAIDAELVEMRGLRDRASGFVHERARQQQQHAIGADRAFRRDALKAPPERPDAVALGDRLDHHEADVVAIADIAGTRISEADEEQHGMASLPSCPALVEQPLGGHAANSGNGGYVIARNNGR